MKEETKIELMKIAASLTHDVVTNIKNGITASEKRAGLTSNIFDIYSSCLSSVKEKFDKLDQAG